MLFTTVLKWVGLPFTATMKRNMQQFKNFLRKITRSFGKSKAAHQIADKSTRSQEYQRARSELQKQFGKEPSDGDIRWRMYAKESEKHQLEWNFGLYRNTLFKRAELLHGEKKLKQALRWYLLVNYYDMNGPQNIGGFRNIQRQHGVKAFDPEQKNISPVVINYTRKVIAQLGFDELAVKTVFDKVATDEHRRMKMPVAPAMAWEQIQPVLIAGEEPWLKHKKSGTSEL